MSKPLFLVLLMPLLNACSDDQPEKPPEKHFNPWETQMQFLDKAKGLEKQMQQDARDQDKRLREMGG